MSDSASLVSRQRPRSISDSIFFAQAWASAFIRNVLTWTGKAFFQIRTCQPMRVPWASVLGEMVAIAGTRHDGCYHGLVERKWSGKSIFHFFEAWRIFVLL